MTKKNKESGAATQLRQGLGRFGRHLGHRLARRASTEFLAYLDLFIPPYDQVIEWRSGLGSSLHLLYGLVRTIVPTVVVEIGSARGKSTCALALACRQNATGKVYAIDPHVPNDWSDGGTSSETYDFLRERLRYYRLERWCEVMKMTSAEAFKNWSRKIDLIFIDGDHSYEGVKLDFQLCRPFLGPHSLVLFHDSAWEYYAEHPDAREGMGVPQFLQELKDHGYHAVTLVAMPGLTILDPQIGGFAYLPQHAPLVREASLR